MHKLTYRVDGEWKVHSCAPVFSVGAADGGVQRVHAGAPHGDPTPFERLVQVLEAPYLLLYVLHTPRGEAAAGRYQSPELSKDQFHAFLAEFGEFLRADSRFDIWAYSPAERATVVWDRHNQLFAYGPLERFAAELRSLGFQSGVLDVNFPHQHHYRPEYDEQASALLNTFEWSHSPLRPEDEQ